VIPEELLSISVRMVEAENRVVDCGGVLTMPELPIRPGTLTDRPTL
jgi:hypothetical protein